MKLLYLLDLVGVGMLVVSGALPEHVGSDTGEDR